MKIITQISGILMLGLAFNCTAVLAQTVPTTPPPSSPVAPPTNPPYQVKPGQPPYQPAPPQTNTPPMTQ